MLFKFLRFFWFVNAGLEDLSTTIKSFPTLDANGMEDELIRKKLAYHYEKSQPLGSISKTLRLGRKDYFYTLKQSYPDFEEAIRTHGITVKKNQQKTTNTVVFKKRCMIFNRHISDLSKSM